METSTRLLLSVVVGSFGLAYFVYGKKQQRLVPALVGIGLMVYPYFVDNLFMFLAIFVVGLILPFVVTE